MAERLGEALLDLRTDDKGFNAGIKRAEGNAQALGTVLNATSGKADNLTTRLGATGTALQKMGNASRMAAMQQKLLLFQLNDVAVSLASGMPFYMVAIQQGSQMAQIYGPGEGGLGRALKETGRLAVGAATAFPPLTAAVALGAAAIAGMTYEINQAQDVTVGFGDVALATWQVIADGLTDLLKPAIDAMAPWFQSAWDVIVSGAKNTGNLIINSFHAAGVDVGLVAETIAAHFEGALERITTIWSRLPSALGDIVFSTANRVVDGVEAMINGAVDRINKLNEYLPEWAQFDGVDEVDLPGIENRFDGAAGDLVTSLGESAAKEVADVKAIWGDRNARIKEIMASDPLGDFFNAVKDRSVENALDREKEKNGKSGGDTSGRTDAEKYQDLVRSAEQFIRAQTRERQSIGLTAEAAARLRYEQELLNSAANDNIKLTPQQAEELKRLAAEMAVAEAQTTRLQESFDFARDVAGGFVSDVRQGLEDGKGLFKSFADAAVGALNRVIDKILNEALDALFQLGSAGSGVASGGGGFLGGIGSIFSSLFSGFFAKGGLIPNGTFGIVGEKGPEPVIGTSRGAMVLPNSSLKGAQSGGEAGGMHITFGVDVDDNGRLSAYVKNVARTESSRAAQSTVAAYDRNLPDRLQQIDANPRRR